jgi:hypothetical protein
MSPIAAFAAAVTAGESLAWRGWRVVPLVQFIAATALALGVLPGPAAAVIAITIYLEALSLDGPVNGGSDSMLFNLFGGLAAAAWPGAPEQLREGALLYVAAQVTLSYVRAGLVKARQPTWWNGSALAQFARLPAYGVPSWVPNEAGVLRAVGITVILAELAAPLAWTGPRAAVVVISAAIVFHTGAAIVFGLNRFLWAWSAALPSLWFAAMRIA